MGPGRRWTWGKRSCRRAARSHSGASSPRFSTRAPGRLRAPWTRAPVCTRSPSWRLRRGRPSSAAPSRSSRQSGSPEEVVQRVASWHRSGAPQQQLQRNREPLLDDGPGMFFPARFIYLYRRGVARNDNHTSGLDTHKRWADMAERDVLIVEPDPKVSEVLRLIFEAAGYKCLLAVDGCEGVEVFKADRPPPAAAGPRATPGGAARGPDRRALPPDPRPAPPDLPQCRLPVPPGQRRARGARGVSKVAAAADRHRANDARHQGNRVAPAD